MRGCPPEVSPEVPEMSPNVPEGELSGMSPGPRRLVAPSWQVRHFCYLGDVPTLVGIYCQHLHHVVYVEAGYSTYNTLSGKRRYVHMSKLA